VSEDGRSGSERREFVERRIDERRVAQASWIGRERRADERLRTSDFDVITGARQHRKKNELSKSAPLLARLVRACLLDGGEGCNVEANTRIHRAAAKACLRGNVWGDDQQDRRALSPPS
jgi:hypothetical protein